MNSFRQIWTVSVLNFRSLKGRFWQSMVIVAGLGATIGVLLSMLSMTAGMQEAYSNAGSPDRAIVVSLGANGEGNSSIPRASASVIMDAPGIAKYKDGTRFADAGLNTNVPVLRLNGARTNAVLRGFGDKGIALRPEFRVVSGRLFEPGKRELIVGVGAQTIYQHMQVGDKVIMPDGEWPIVGSYATGDILNGQLIGDAATLMSATRHPNYSTVLIRLASRDSLATLNKALTTNPALSVTVMRHSDWYKMVSDLNTGFLPCWPMWWAWSWPSAPCSAVSTLCMPRSARAGAKSPPCARWVTVVAGAGLFMILFLTGNGIAQSVRERIPEFAMLKTLGFSDAGIMALIFVEAAIPCFMGAAIGIALALIWAKQVPHLFPPNVLALPAPYMSPLVLSLAFVFAILVAFLSTVLPALRIRRLDVATALSGR
jgi:putative ABC transport system permease protein